MKTVCMQRSYCRNKLAVLDTVVNLCHILQIQTSCCLRSWYAGNLVARIYTAGFGAHHTGCSLKKYVHGSYDVLHGLGY